MGSPKVSVVVPVYNVEQYLEKCLDSVVNQTLADIEIIVVNDGSTDGSWEVIEKYKNVYPEKIKAYTKTNGGLSDARNYGLSFSSGEYVGFLDSDDFVDLEMYEVMYMKAKEKDYDIVECNLHHTYENYEDTEIGVNNTDKRWLLRDGRSVVWNKIYRADWLRDTGVVFHKGIIYEDVEFFSKLVPYIREYAYVAPAFVHYVQRGDSINNLSSEKTKHIFIVLEEILDFYKNNGFYDEFKTSLEYLFARIILCSSFSRICKIQDSDMRKSVLEENYHILCRYFPKWRKNEYVKANRSKNGKFMKSVNRITYRMYSYIFPFVFRTMARKRGL